MYRKKSSNLDVGKVFWGFSESQGAQRGGGHRTETSAKQSCWVIFIILFLKQIDSNL
jgi:hypothetical protein